MPSLPRLLPAALAALALTAAARAQKPPEKVTFETVDEVKIAGKFYPSDLGVKAPCALMLHPLGGSSAHPNWEELARALQRKGYAVLSFDFRGHGDSTAVSQAFWKVTANSNAMPKAAAKKADKITQKDFPPLYLPMLANDITAARHHLDERNDAKECN